MQRLKLTISYIGTRFHGWQRQVSKDGSELRTVQNELETLASHIVGQKVHVHASGRTDTGVHADAQIAHMDVPLKRVNMNWLRAFNTQLPPDVAVSKVEPVPFDFHAQYNAVSKLYSYNLWLSQEYTPPRLRPFVWTCGPLDLEAMQKAARHMTGKHDFASLRNVGVNYKTTVRTVSQIELMPISEHTPQLAVWHFQADGFLKQMVRNMMGLLAEVGRGRMQPNEVAKIIEAKDRTVSAATAPASGLTLVRVFYNSTENT